MIKLTRITKDNGCITCVAYIEDSQTGINLSFDESKKELGEYSMPKGYEWCKSHISHAKKYLNSLTGKNIEVTEKLLMWY